MFPFQAIPDKKVGSQSDLYRGKLLIDDYIAVASFQNKLGFVMKENKFFLTKYG